MLGDAVCLLSQCWFLPSSFLLCCLCSASAAAANVRGERLRVFGRALSILNHKCVGRSFSTSFCHARHAPPRTDPLFQLIELLKSEDKQVVAIACYDLGEFVRFYPSGKTIAKHLG